MKGIAIRRISPFLAGSVSLPFILVSLTSLCLRIRKRKFCTQINPHLRRNTTQIPLSKSVSSDMSHWLQFRPTCYEVPQLGASLHLHMLFTVPTNFHCTPEQRPNFRPYNWTSSQWWRWTVMFYGIRRRKVRQKFIKCHPEQKRLTLDHITRRLHSGDNEQ